MSLTFSKYPGHIINPTISNICKPIPTVLSGFRKFATIGKRITAQLTGADTMASKRPAEETPNPAGNTVTIAELFEQLGAPLFRSDSIGAMHPDGTVYLICLPGDVNDGKALIYQQPEDERTESMASSERWMHLQRVRAGHPAVLVTPSGELFATVGLEEEAGSFYVGIGEKIQAKTVET